MLSISKTITIKKIKLKKTKNTILPILSKNFNKNIEKLRQFIKYKRFGLYTSLCILQQNYTIINKMV